MRGKKVIYKIKHKTIFVNAYLCTLRVSIVERKASQTMSTFFPALPGAELEVMLVGHGYIVLVVSSSLGMTKYFNKVMTETFKV